MSYTLATIDREGDNGLTEIMNKWIKDELSPGDIVKLLFLNESGEGDRMWVVITDIKDKYKGCLINDSINTKDLRIGDEISFSAENIVDIKKDYPENVFNNYKEVNLSFVKDLLEKLKLRE